MVHFLTVSFILLVLSIAASQASKETVDLLNNSLESSRISTALLAVELHCPGIFKWSDRGPVPSPESGNQCLVNLVSTNLPFFVFRIGGTELSHLRIFHSGRSPSAAELDDLWRNSGIFPPKVEVWTQWMILFSEAVQASTIYVDMLPLTWNVGDMALAYQPKAWRITWPSLVSFWNGDISSLPENGLPNSWVQQLAGKSVLYVGAFPYSVANQFNRSDSRTPRFKELKVVHTIQAYGGMTPKGYEGRTSIDALNDMFERINQQGHFDVALVSAGAYTGPLAHHIFKLGKTAIYFGGSLQNLFGIKGHRWVNWYSERLLKHPEEKDWWVGPDIREIAVECIRAEDCAYFDKETMRKNGIAV